ncbi:MAG: hypothetical protein OXC68_09850 [Aestuariivita sp.]|nr:hypothetical protein [Aestuariivita sp.]
MSKKPNDDLCRADATAFKKDILKEYAKAMKTQTIPEIEREFRKNEIRAAELRFSPNSASRRQKDVAAKQKKNA